jgi:hypothetical protein
LLWRGLYTARAQEDLRSPPPMEGGGGGANNRSHPNRCRSRLSRPRNLGRTGPRGRGAQEEFAQFGAWRIGGPPGAAPKGTPEAAACNYRLRPRNGIRNPLWFCSGHWLFCLSFQWPSCWEFEQLMPVMHPRCKICASIPDHAALPAIKQPGCSLVPISRAAGSGEQGEGGAGRVAGPVPGLIFRWQLTAPPPPRAPAAPPPLPPCSPRPLPATRSRAPNAPPRNRHKAGYRSRICLNKRRNTNLS